MMVSNTRQSSLIKKQPVNILLIIYTRRENFSRIAVHIMMAFDVKF